MAEKQRILIVDDDSSIAELISLYLEKECFSTKIAEDGEEALSIFEKEGAELLILDLMLPGIDGYEVCRRIRASSDVPIIRLSAKGETCDKVLGLELGADDYILKPFDTKELVARVKAVLRRFKPGRRVSSYENAEEKEKEEQLQKGKFIAYSDLVVNRSNYAVHYKGKIVDMPPKELELLYFLASCPNQVFTREQLLDHIWGYEFAGDSRTVDVHIKRLREKLPGGEEWEISTVWGIGYKFRLG